MGQSFARKLSGLDVRVLAYDKYKRGISDDHAGEASMERVFAEAEVMSLHIPLTTETRGMVNEDYWASFQKELFFINTARGEIVNHIDLLSAISGRKVRGPALDVLEPDTRQAECW